MICLSLLLVLGVTGLTADLACAWLIDQKAQAAADAAALAGSTEAVANSVGAVQPAIPCSSVADDAPLAAACRHGEQDGFPADAITVSADTADAPGGRSACTYRVEVSITRNIPQMFPALFRNTTMTMTVTGTSVAGIAPSESSATPVYSRNRVSADTGL